MSRGHWALAASIACLALAEVSGGGAAWQPSAAARSAGTYVMSRMTELRWGKARTIRALPCYRKLRSLEGGRRASLSCWLIVPGMIPCRAGRFRTEGGRRDEAPGVSGSDRGGGRGFAARRAVRRGARPAARHRALRPDRRGGAGVGPPRRREWAAVRDVRRRCP